MFGLVIATIALVLVMMLSFATVYYGAPDKRMELIGFFITFIIVIAISGFWKYKSIMKKYKKIVDLKKKEIKTLRGNEVENYLIQSLMKGELYTDSIKEVLSVLKVGRLKKEELERDIIENFRKMLNEDTHELLADVSKKA